jgi:hypothetical protein
MAGAHPCTPIALDTRPKFVLLWFSTTTSRLWHRGIAAWSGACGGKSIAPSLTSHVLRLTKRRQISNPRGTEHQRQRPGIIVDHPTKLKSLER